MAIETLSGVITRITSSGYFISSSLDRHVYYIGVNNGKIREYIDEELDGVVKWVWFEDL